MAIINGSGLVTIAIKKIPIPCPNNPERSLAIQGDILRILDAFTELTARKKQYEYYRDLLLSFPKPEAAA